MHTSQVISGLRKRIGLMKSIATYYWKPFNKRKLKNFYSQFIGPGDLCFDIGAHVGNRAHAWHALGAEVVCVEPQAECIKYLKRRFARMPDVHIVEEAIGCEIGEGLLFVSSLNPTISTLSDEKWRKQINADAHFPIRWDDQKAVQITTLDDLISRYGLPAFCKLDVENAEYEALKGLNQPLPLLSFEYYPPAKDNTFLCLKRLEALGPYEYNWSFGESMVLNSHQWVSMEVILSTIWGYSTRYQYGDIYARIPRR